MAINLLQILNTLCSQLVHYCVHKIPPLYHSWSSLTVFSEVCFLVTLISICLGKIIFCTSLLNKLCIILAPVNSCTYITIFIFIYSLCESTWSSRSVTSHQNFVSFMDPISFILSSCHGYGVPFIFDTNFFGLFCWIFIQIFYNVYFVLCYCI